jgi:hypothetical protein
LRKVGKGLKVKVSENGLLKKIFGPEINEVRQGVVGKVHPCIGTEDLYRPYCPQGE